MFGNLTYLSLLDLSYNLISGSTFDKEDIFKPVDGITSLPLIELNLAFNSIKSISNTAFKYLDNLQKVMIH